ncbi:hypothetical protein [Escherichia coli]|uniref:antirestriction phage head protein DarA n=1 Tax=Escherichia sp. WS3286 TaxID=3381986 RepID=UPI000E001E99|nr:hypothetical protein [Escherichia coli]EFN4811172.1 hypothetical protein [Escherichia coli]EGD5057153.1 hypothetical protein [Escherichia coli]MGI20127.1 hypothetical protein [Escherichia coli]MHV63366.1 hypothetical protein [Escherichia coli]
MEQFNINKGVTIKPGLDVLPPPVTDDEYRALMAGEDRYLMTESNTLEEIEATFFYDTPIHWCATDLLEAISSTRLQLHRTMQAFVRALNQKLNGTGISAGSDKTGDVAQSGARAIGGAEIGRARNVNGLPVLPAIIPLSDGQTISILFHSPTAENRITNSDTLVAFQFLLNKKDVTHTVAPMSGRDMTLAQVTMKLANLAEKNSAKFQRAQKKKKALVDEITQLQADSDQKEDAMSDLADQVAAVEGQKADLEQKINAVASEADSLYEENERLQTEIDQLNRTGGRDTIAPAGMTGGHSRALTDRLASIKNRMHMDGEVTLSNGASMKQFIGGGEGYIQLTDPDGSVTAEGRDILKEHGITPEFIDEIRTDMQREVVSSLQIVARALADANPKSAAIVNRVIGDIEASEGIGALKLFLSRAFNPNGNILPGIIGEAKKYVSEEELEQLDQLLKRFSYNPQTRWQMNQRSMGSVHEKVLSAMNSAIANSSVSEEKALEWADSFITEEVEEARAGQNGGIDLRKELADIYRLTGGKISTLSKVVHHQGRAYANLNGVVAVNLNDENASALWHELGHHLEYSNPGLLEKARSFLKANVEGDKPSFVNIGGRGKPEWCFRSRLSNIYMAKVYPPASVSNTGKIRQKSPTISKTSATEVFSMALQLYHDKEAAAASLMNGDGLLELLLGVAKELNNAD